MGVLGREDLKDPVDGVLATDGVEEARVQAGEIVSARHVVGLGCEEGGDGAVAGVDR